MFSVERCHRQLGRCPFVTFHEYEVGIKCNNQVVNWCTGSCLAWHQTRVIFLNWRNFMWPCWLIGLWQTRSKISIVIQVTKSNSPTTATSKKVSPNDCDNDRQPEIAIWPPKPEIHASLELSYIASKFHCYFRCRSLMQSFGNTFYKLGMIENPKIAVGTLMLSIVVPEMCFRFGQS